MRPITRRAFVALSGATASGLVFGACAPDHAPQSNPSPAAAESANNRPKGGGRLTASMPVDVLNFSPFLVGGTHYFMFARALYNTLIRLDERAEPRPELAERWQRSSDGRRLELKLRSGVLLHSGRELVADDVIATLEYVRAPQTGSSLRSLFLPITGAQAPDKHTVVLETDRPYAPIFDALDALYVVDRQAIPSLKQRGVGSGPFKVAEYTPGDVARLTRFDQYWDSGKPYLDELLIRPIPDLASMVTNLESGAVDVAWRVPMADYVRLRGQAAYGTNPGAEGDGFFTVTVNTSRPPFTDKRVRQAINWAIDRKRFVDIVLGGQVMPTAIPFPSTSLAYDAEAAHAYSFDLGTARALLNEAGIGDGLGIEAIVDPKQDPGLLQLAQILQDDLKKIGVTLNLQVLETAEWQRRYTREADFALTPTTFGRANKDPATLFGGAIAWSPDGKQNPSRFESPEYQRLVEQGAATTERAARKPIYEQLRRVILDESFSMPVATNLRAWAYRASVRDFAVNFDNIPAWAEVWKA